MSIHPDIAIVFATVCLALALPALLSAVSDASPPRAAGVLVVLAGVAIWWAITSRPGGYTLDDLPGAFARVVAMVLN